MLRVTRSMGLYRSAVGREGASAATRCRSPGPSPTHESQHRVPRGQGGETRCPETPPDLHRALGKQPGSVPHGDGDGRTTTLGSCLTHALISGLCLRGFTSSTGTRRVPAGVTSPDN